MLCGRYPLRRDVQHIKDRYDQSAANIGILQPPRSRLSLAHRPHVAPSIRKSFYSTLLDLRISSQTGKSSSAYNATQLMQSSNEYRNRPLQEQVTDASITESGLRSSEYDISSSKSDASSDTSSGYTQNALTSTSEIEQLISAISLGINTLFKTSMFIRRFASAQKCFRTEATKASDNRADIMYIKIDIPH